MWRSGYLEHGGTVYTRGANDSGDWYGNEGSVLTINLGWQYGGGSQTARTYDYTPRSVQSFYQLATRIDLGGSANGASTEFTFERPGTDATSRYRIQVSPIRLGSYASQMASGRFPYLQTTDVFDMRNDRFSILDQIGGFVEKYD